jgi:hypothetical protein
VIALLGRAVYSFTARLSLLLQRRQTKPVADFCHIAMVLVVIAPMLFK